MEVGPFRTVPASQTESGEVELKLVEGGWEEFATVVFGEYNAKSRNTVCLRGGLRAQGNVETVESRSRVTGNKGPTSA
jgi:hypothetical protein